MWDFLDELIDEIGNPFSKKKIGRPPKFSENMRVYTKISILISYFDYTLDEIAGLLPFLAGKSLDRSNIDRWFQRFPEEFAHKANTLLHAKIESMFDYGDYIVDSTKISTTEYEQITYQGVDMWKLIVMALRILYCKALK